MLGSEISPFQWLLTNEYEGIAKVLSRKVLQYSHHHPSDLH
jgi:hypothetical protein